MSKQEEKDILKYIETLPVKSFKNEHNERFNIHLHPIGILMSGDEVDMMVEDKYKIGGKYIQLFNPHFSVWGTDELNKLGETLQELTKEQTK